MLVFLVLPCFEPFVFDGGKQLEGRFTRVSLAEVVVLGVVDGGWCVCGGGGW